MIVIFSVLYRLKLLKIISAEERDTVEKNSTVVWK